MGKRMGAQRLTALLKRGAAGLDTIYQAGEGMKNAIVSHKMFKQGGIIETQILVDLQGKDGISIFSGETDLDFIGEATAEDGTGAVAGCHLLKWENDVHGDFYEWDITVVELPTGGSADLTIGFETFVAGHAQSTALPGGSMSLLLVDQTNDLVAGDRHIQPDIDGTTAATPIAAQTDCDGLGLYIASADEAPGAAYTAGKLLIILRGYDTQWGFQNDPLNKNQQIQKTS